MVTTPTALVGRVPCADGCTRDQQLVVVVVVVVVDVDDLSMIWAAWAFGIWASTTRNLLRRHIP